MSVILKVQNGEGDWVEIPAIKGTDGIGVPVGGAAGQMLTKASGTDYDTVWQDYDDDIWYKFTASHAAFSAPTNVIYYNPKLQEIRPYLHSGSGAVANQAIVFTLPGIIPAPTENVGYQYIGAGYMVQSPTTTSIPVSPSLVFYPDRRVLMSMSFSTSVYRAVFQTPIKLWYAMDNKKIINI